MNEIFKGCMKSTYCVWARKWFYFTHQSPASIPVMQTLSRLLGHSQSTSERSLNFLRLLGEIWDLGCSYEKDCGLEHR